MLIKDECVLIPEVKVAFGMDLYVFWHFFDKWVLATKDLNAPTRDPHLVNSVADRRFLVHILYENIR